MQSIDTGTRPPGFESQLGHLLALWLWASLCLSFSVCKMEMIILGVNIGEIVRRLLRGLSEFNMLSA